MENSVFSMGYWKAQLGEKYEFKYLECIDIYSTQHQVAFLEIYDCQFQLFYLKYVYEIYSIILLLLLIEHPVCVLFWCTVLIISFAGNFYCWRF